MYSSSFANRRTCVDGVIGRAIGRGDIGVIGRATPAPAMDRVYICFIQVWRLASSVGPSIVCEQKARSIDGSRFNRACCVHVCTLMSYSSNRYARHVCAHMHACMHRSIEHRYNTGRELLHAIHGSRAREQLDLSIIRVAMIMQAAHAHSESTARAHVRTYVYDHTCMFKFDQHARYIHIGLCKCIRSLQRKTLLPRT